LEEAGFFDVRSGEVDELRNMFSDGIGRWLSRRGWVGG